MTTSILQAQSDEDILSCFAAMSALRPHLAPEGFLAQVRRQEQQGYRLLAQVMPTESGDRVVSIAGFRLCEFLAWGPILYVDDLSTLPAFRGQGHASRLLDWLIEHARANRCQALHLDSGYARHDAHRLYLNKGLQMTSHHFAITF
ncbi:MAG: GNAT family N-acetyltransferase [Acidobacteriota bacterium]